MIVASDLGKGLTTVRKELLSHLLTKFEMSSRTRIVRDVTSQLQPQAEESDPSPAATGGPTACSGI